MTTTAATKKVVSRSVYVAQLRRAFLLRAHPDRFRKYDTSIRRGQANLLQALSERMNAKDFQDYTSNITTSSMNSNIIKYTDRQQQQRQQTTSESHPFVLEKRDGTLMRLRLELNESVENVLEGMVKALKLSGSASLPPPPQPPPSPSSQPLSSQNTNMYHNPMQNGETTSQHGFVWASSTGNKSHIDHRFDINTAKGRDFKRFLQSVSLNDIEERRASRMDVSAAALVARRLYSFQAIDGISMGWSSESFAVLLSSLNELYEEHNSKFHVTSFYPLRLVFTPECEFHDESLDVYGGILHLNPNCTPIQWLDSLQEVTTERLQEFKYNREKLQERTTLVQNTLGVKLRKGYSCSSKDYHMFLERLYNLLEPSSKDSNLPRITSRSLSLERVLVTVESSQACRRSKVTKEGTIRANVDMTIDDLLRAISRHIQNALDLQQKEKEEKDLCVQIINQIQWELGLQKIYKVSGSGLIISHEEFHEALLRMLEQKLELNALGVAGYSIGIANKGQFCHVGDDGSLIIPHNWN